MTFVGSRSMNLPEASGPADQRNSSSVGFSVVDRVGDSLGLDTAGRLEHANSQAWVY
jgi:hypothetical protein